MQQAVALHDSAEPVASEQSRPFLVGLCLGDRLAMAGAGIRVHHHAGTDDMSAPAQVEVLAVRGYLGVEAVERVEQVDPDEHACAGHHEDIPHSVVLLLVELAPLDEGDLHAGLVDPHPDREQAARVVPFHELRAEDAGVGPVGLLDEEPDRRRLERDVVVHEAEEAGALDEVERLVGGGSVPGVVVESADVGVGKLGGDPPRNHLVAPGVDHEHRDVGVVLSG